MKTRTLTTSMRKRFFIALMAVSALFSAVSVNAQSTRQYHDAEAYNLKGHVKECIKNSDDTITFNQDGSIAHPKLKDIERDKDGKLVHYSYIYSEPDDSDSSSATCYNNFKWENNQVKESESYVSLDKDDFLSWYVSAKPEYEKGELVRDRVLDFIGEWMCDYINLEYDSHGNWVKRVAILCRSFPSGDEEDAEDEYVYHSYSIETRQITYYE